MHTMKLQDNCLTSPWTEIVTPSSIADNQSIIPIHSTYHRSNRAPSSLISSSWAQLTFSQEDVRSFLKEITSDQSWDVSTIVALKPVMSTVIYSSVALTIFVVLSFLLCLVSCSNCCTKRSAPVSDLALSVNNSISYFEEYISQKTEVSQTMDLRCFIDRHCFSYCWADDLYQLSNQQNEASA